MLLTTCHHIDEGSDRFPAHQKDTSKCFFNKYPGSRASNAKEMEKIALSFLRRSGERGRRASQSFSSTWGWVIFCFGDAWNLPSKETGVVFFRLVSPAEGTGAFGASPF